MSGCLKAFLIVLVITTVLGVIGTIVAVSLVDDAVDDIAETNAGELDDVQDVECDLDGVGDLHATVTVENDSSERSSYIIEVTFEDDNGDQLDTSTAFINSVEPDQRAEGEAVTFTDPPAEGDFDCRVVELERFSDENG